MGAGESKMQSVDLKEVVHPLRIEEQELREEAAKLEKEVEDLKAERERLRRKTQEKAEKYSGLK